MRLDTVKDVFLMLGGMGAFVFGVGWVVKTVVAHFQQKALVRYKAVEDQKLEQTKAELRAVVDQGLEELKAELKRVSDRELETHKSMLQIGVIEHQIRFGKLHEKMIEVLAESTGKLLVLYRAARSLVSLLDWAGEPDKTGKYKIVAEHNQDFVDYFYPRRLYLPQDLFHLINQFQNKLIEVGREFHIGMMREDHSPTFDH